MHLSFDPPTALDYFASLVESDGEFPLFEAAVSLGHDEYPDLDVQTVLGEVDQLLARVRRRMALDAGPVQKLRTLNQFFYRDLGFAGNLNDYYDPDNSLIHILLHTRRGIPITLAVLWMELAQGLVELVLKPALNAQARFGLVTLAGRAEAPALPIVRQLMEALMHD